MTNEIPDFSHLPVTIRAWKHGKRRTIEIYRDLIRVTEKGLVGEHTWEERVSAFAGILRRTEKRNGQVVGGTTTTPVTVHLVELIHPDTEKIVRLYQSFDEWSSRKLHNEAARALDLPALN